MPMDGSVRPGAASAPMVRNPALVGFRALESGLRYPVEDYFEGCPAAATAGRPDSVGAEYDPRLLPRAAPPRGSPMAAWAGFLPYLSWQTLGEGGTPLLDLPWLAERHGVGAVRLKAEWLNPTGSHKDRITPLALARAVEVGARGVACASSGNAGVSLAAYAAAAGLPARVYTTASMPAAVQRLLRVHGAETVFEEGALERWTALGRAAREGWFPLTNFALPPVGSNPFGVEGYKTVAFEIAGEADGPLDAVLVPVARGDLLWGIGAGFEALRDAGLWPHPVPRLVAVEPFPRLARVLRGEADVTDRFDGRTAQASVGGATLTRQTLHAVRRSGGMAAVVDDEAARDAQRGLARRGLDLELCAAATAAALGGLRRNGWLRADARVVLVGTGPGWRDPTA